MDEEPTGADAGWRLTKEKKKKGGNVKGVHAVLLLSPTTGGIVLPPTARGTAGSLFFLFWAAFTFALFGHDFFLFLSSSSLFRFLFLLLHSNPRLAYLPSFFIFPYLFFFFYSFFSQNAAGVIPTTVPTSGGPLRLLYMCGAIKNPSRYVQVIKKRERERRDWLPSLSSSKIRSFPFFLFFSSSSYSPHFLKVVSRDAIGATSL